MLYFTIDQFNVKVHPCFGYVPCLMCVGCGYPSWVSVLGYLLRVPVAGDAPVPNSDKPI